MPSTFCTLTFCLELHLSIYCLVPLCLGSEAEPLSIPINRALLSAAHFAIDFLLLSMAWDSTLGLRIRKIFMRPTCPLCQSLDGLRLRHTSWPRTRLLFTYNTHPSTRIINQLLLEKLLGRSLEAIKGQRRKAAHKDLVLRLLETHPARVSPPLSLRFLLLHLPLVELQLSALSTT